MMIGIIDYGMGNLRSVCKAFEHLGYDVCFIQNQDDFKKASKLVLPGVGAFCDAIRLIRDKAFDQEILRAVENGTSLLGICLGMQLLFHKSYENGEHTGLSLLDGDIVSLAETLDKDKYVNNIVSSPHLLKVPHIGWNTLDITKQSPLFSGLPSSVYVYFVHSYHLQTTSPVVSATTIYGKSIQIAVQKDNVFGVQFHPEKSAANGLKILDNFGRL